MARHGVRSVRGEAGGGSLRQPEAAYRPPQATALLLRKDEREKCDEEEERAVILISVGVSVLVIVGIIVWASLQEGPSTGVVVS